MSSLRWAGVLPAITTPFSKDGTLDLVFLREHAAWLLAAGSQAIVALGSLGEGGALEPAERDAVLEVCLSAGPVVAGVAAASTQGAVRQAKRAADLGCAGLMVLPPYLHTGPWRETRAHLGAVLDATDLPCMLYNNPHAYGTDLLPEQVAALASNHPTLRAVKESSGDVRRITALRAATDLEVLVGLDDVVVEGVAAGAVGWVAGLVNALPAESLALFELATAGDDGRLVELYRWFLPLLRMDTVPDFVARIKLVQQEVGRGSERVRPPRLALEGAERLGTLTTIRAALATRPQLDAVGGRAQ